MLPRIASLHNSGEPAVALYGKNLPQLSADQVYQIWWVQNGQNISIGTFTPDERRRSWNLIQPQQKLAPPERIFITAEPEGGSAQPGGTVYLSATF